MQKLEENAYQVQRNLLRILSVTSASWGLLPRSRTSEPVAYRAALRTLTEPADHPAGYFSSRVLSRQRQRVAAGTRSEHRHRLHQLAGFML